MLDLISNVLKEAKDKLKRNGVNNVSDAEFLLAFVLGVPKSQLFLVTSISKEQLEEFNSLIEHRSCKEPMDSLIGYTEYLGLKIPFSKDTLTPRQETEIMVDNIIRDNKNKSNLNVLDLCCGSGCIGLSIAKYLDARVTLTDISEKAIEVSRQNALLNDIEANFLLSNLFDKVVGRFDIIISNPPYIPTRDLNDLEVEVRDYDPVLALDGGDDGLDFYRTITQEAPKYLVDKGEIYLEFGINQANDVIRLLEENFTDIQVFKDYSGIERYIKARKK